MRNGSAIGLMVGAIMFWGTLLQARTITVAVSGGMYTTIQAGVSVAVAGDTVSVAAGTYNERVTTAASGNSGSRITIRAAGGVVNMNGFVVNHSYLTIAGFTIENCAGAGGINLAPDLTDCWFKGNKIGTFNAGHLMSIFGTNHIVENNYFHDTYMDAIRIFGSGHIVRGNEFYQLNQTSDPNHTDIIQTWGDNNQQPAYNTIFENNYMHDCACQVGNLSVDYKSTPGDFIFRNNIYIRQGSQINVMMPRVKFYNNLYYECNYMNGDHVLGLASLGATNTANDCEVKNNLFIGCGTGTAQNGWYKNEAGITGFVADNNYVTGTTALGYPPPGPNFTDAHGIKGGNPLFADIANNNFHLLPGSPAIDAGAVIASFSVDREGKARPDGAAWDIGPYETDGTRPNAPTGLNATSRTAHTIALGWIAPTAASDGDIAAYYIIRRGGVRIGTSTTTAFTDSNLNESTTYSYQVYAVDDFENISTGNTTGDFATIGDAVGPVVLQVLSQSLTKVQVFFDEAVDQATSEAVSSYQLTGGVTVVSAVRQADQKSVLVTTSTQTEGNQYTITISNVRDTSAAHNVMTSTPKTFTAMFRFEDDFEAGNIAKWTPSTSSVWTVVDDAGDKSLFVSAAIAAERLLVNRAYNVLSFDADLKGFGASAYRNLSIIIGLQDTSNYYHINFAGTVSTAYNGIFKVANKVETRLATGTATLTETANYHHVRVTWNGATGEIKAYFDQSYTPAFSITDTTYKSGKCGVWSKGSKQGYIDNVEVVERLRTDNFGTVIGINDKMNAAADRNRDYAVYPYPASDRVSITVPPQSTGLSIIDINGNSIRTFKTRGQTLQWDTRNQQGQKVQAGLYFVKMEGMSGLQKVLISR